jgi:hypothetical protein
MKTDFAGFLLDESPDAVIASKTDGTAPYCSNGAATLFGYTNRRSGRAYCLQDHLFS